ncbi:hypothetical protein WN944_004245 [Citrus x changshan-huyou]|uniref:Transposase-associated domain-containing protein n=1 Tax=Citrus x changshan-huyou TaxID=2935761 RepID=A0AAP0M037_9ROSI
MDKSWMRISNRLCKEYVDGVKAFVNLAENHLNEEGKTRCPRRNCHNMELKSLDDVERHLYRHGMSFSYQRWVFHGEEIDLSSYIETPSSINDTSHIEEVEDDEMLEMLNEIWGPIQMDCGLDESNNSNASGVHINADKFGELFDEAQKELHPSCKTFSALTFLVKLMHIKVLNRWSNKSFDMLQILEKAFPACANILASHYDAKNMLRDLGLGYETIHVCKYDCALFWKEYEGRDHCPECGESRYKNNDGKCEKIPQKVLRYFPLKPRLKRLFMSKHTAVDMRWHKEKRIDMDGVLRHPVDAEGWKDFDKKHRWLAQEPRNVRLGLATNGFNPFGNMNNSYRPKAPGKDIVVYLHPLVEELKELWDVGVQTYDVSKEQYFRMHAAVLWIVNDFPAYGDLSGWSTKGYKACPNFVKNKAHPKGSIAEAYIVNESGILLNMISLRHERSVAATNELYALACGPDLRVRSYSSCGVNGVQYHTFNRDNRLTTQNNGIVVVREHDNKEMWRVCDNHFLVVDKFERPNMYILRPVFWSQMTAFLLVGKLDFCTFIQSHLSSFGKGRVH